MSDILPQDQPLWRKIQEEVRNVAEFYNFSRIDTPFLEFSDIFEKTAGASTDIVEKQMFLIERRKDGGRKLALRPEGTAGVVRAYLEHNLARSAQPAKLYYFGPMFRYEQPQAGRYRQFFQAGFETIGGVDDTIYDAQTMLIVFRVLEALKLKNISSQINSIGCRVCRPQYERRLRAYYQSRKKNICKDCERKLDVNILRILDCKKDQCEVTKLDAPSMMDSLCADCRERLREVLEYLDELKVPYTMNQCLVRGLDYYNRTVFEFVAESPSSAIAGGGRYDYLVETLTGKKTAVPAVGASIGIERVIEAMRAQGVKEPSVKKPDIFLVHVGDLAKKKLLTLREMFSRANVRISESLGRESLRAQLKLADKEGARYALLLGQKEMFEESVILRDMETGEQETIPMAKIVDEIKRRM